MYHKITPNDIFLYSLFNSLLSYHLTNFLLQRMRTNRTTVSYCPENGRSRNTKIKWSVSTKFIHSEVTEAEYKSHRRWRAHGPQSQHEQSPYELSETNEPAQGLHGSPCPLAIYYDFQCTTFAEFLCVPVSGSLILMPSVGLSAFSLFVCLSCPIPMCYFFLSHHITILILLLFLKKCFVF